MIVLFISDLYICSRLQSMKKKIRKTTLSLGDDRMYVLLFGPTTFSFRSSQHSPGQKTCLKLGSQNIMLVLKVRLSVALISGCCCFITASRASGFHQRTLFVSNFKISGIKQHKKKHHVVLLSP